MEEKGRDKRIVSLGREAEEKRGETDFSEHEARKNLIDQVSEREAEEGSA
jgi:hypothetical protein